MSLLIKNGEIVTADTRYRADVWCEGETITRIDREITAPSGATVVDATDQYVFPGFIDPHVHIYLPFMGTFSKDTYETGSKAAIVGGTTTLIEMCCPSRQDDTFKGLSSGSPKRLESQLAILLFTWGSRNTTLRPRRSSARS